MTQQTGAAGGNIIDLGLPIPESTNQAETAVQQPEPRQGRIINLDGEGFIDPENPPTQEDFILDGVPAEQLQEMTPVEAADLPEIGYLENKLAKSGENGKAFRLAMGNLVSSDPIQQAEIIQNTLPDARVTTLSNGRTVVDYEGERFIMNAPGLSAADLTKFAGQFLAFLPAGKIASMGGAGVKRASAMQAFRPIAQSASAQRLGQVAAGAAASAATSAGLDAAAAGMGDGVDSESVSGQRAAMAGIFGGGAELIGPAFRSVANKFRGTPDDLKYIDLDEVAELRRAADETGITIFEPQATQSRADSLYMRVLQDLPETQQEMMSLLHRQNEDASGAVLNYLAQIGDNQSVVNAPERVRSAAINAIDGMKEARSNLVRQGYQEAFAANTQVPVQTTIDLIDDMLSKTSSDATNPVFRELNKYKGQIEADAVDGVNSLELLHGIKMNLDDAIEGFGESSVDRTAKNKLQEVRAMLRGEMESASPQYDSVKELYRDASGPIEDLQNSLVGRVSRIKDDSLKRVLPSIFDASESNPVTLRHAKSVIESQDPEAWQQLTRAYLDSQIGKMSTRAVDGVPNLPAQFGGALFGRNQTQRRMIMDSLTPDQQQNAKWMELALAAAARGRSTGSDTAGKTEAIRSIREGGLEQYLNPLSWSRGLTDAAKQARFQRRASNFVRLMTDDGWSAEMSKLRELDPTNSSTGRALFQSLMRIDDNELEGMDTNSQPPIRLNEVAQ